MAFNFPEMWLKRVIHNLDNTDKASFLDGVSELDVDVTQINEGQLSEQNKIYVAKTDFAVDVLINNTTYPIAVQDYSDATIEITLDKYQTKVTSLTDDIIVGASYSKIDSATRAHVHAIASNKYKKAIHAIAPAADATLTPVHHLTTGKMTYADLIAFKQKCDAAGFDSDVIRLVLSPKHWNDLLLDRDRFADLMINYAAGKPSPLIAGFELHRYAGNPYYTNAWAKKAWGAALVGTDLQASVAFVKENIAKKTGLTKQYFSPSGTDPKNQANLLNYRHYFVALPFQARQIGAMA